MNITGRTGKAVIAITISTTGCATGARPKDADRRLVGPCVRRKKKMIEIYKECICTVWKWIKQFMLGLAVLLPGIIFLIYMFVANMPDVGLVPGILVIAAIVLWSPVPLKPVFFKDKTWVESYITLMAGLGMAILICILLVLYFTWVGLPIIGGMTYCSLTAQEPAKWGIICTGIANCAWGPGAHYLFTKVLDKVFR